MKTSALIVTVSMMTLCLGFLGSPASAAVEGWEESIMIQANLDYAQAETLAVDDQGNALIVWEQPEGNTSDEALWARQYNRVLGWSEPEKIYDGYFWLGRTDMGMAPNGRAVAVWATYNSVDDTLQVHARTFDPISGWGPTLDVVNGLSTLGDIEVAINSEGNAVCVWESIGPLSASVYGPGAGWSAPVAIDVSGSDPIAAVDGLGNALVIWTVGDPYSVKAIRYVPGEGWGETAAVSGTVGGGLRTAMDMDNAGNAMVAWTAYDGMTYSLYAALYSCDVGWAEPARIGPAEDGLYPNGLDVSAARAGEYLVVWQQSDSDRIDSVWTKRWTASGGWDESIKLSADNYASTYMWPSISANSEGKAVAVWTHGADSALVDVSVSRYVPDVGWTSPEVIDNSDTLNAFFGRAEMDPLGNIVATWKLDFGQCWLWGSVYKAYSAPDVMISAPLDGTVTAEATVTVRGYAETYADLTVNDMPVAIQLDGSFEARIALSPGDNLIVARAADDLGSFTETSIVVTFTGSSTTYPVAAMDITAMKNWKIWKFDGRNSTDDVKVVEFLWDFGDGTSSASQVTSHRYEKAGTYVVTLTVWDGDGNSGSASAEIIVRPGGP